MAKELEKARERIQQLEQQQQEKSSPPTSGDEATSTAQKELAVANARAAELEKELSELKSKSSRKNSLTRKNSTSGEDRLKKELKKHEKTISHLEKELEKTKQQNKSRTKDNEDNLHETIKEREATISRLEIQLKSLTATVSTSPAGEVVTAANAAADSLTSSIKEILTVCFNVGTVCYMVVK